ncbi:hypothetical protein BpHYR1_023612 [Brachionus plicatilis]|uniref:Uncharacterized protein n=1 Tax=Brachionus plicatilis TaxID=10195 RepID=A0A3M7SR54_BRAPC|nr:hypothetical protein BpHYR1_023612 [Brachionus plicatilis]
MFDRQIDLEHWQKAIWLVDLGHVREALISLAYVGQAGVVSENFLQNKSGHCFRQFAALFHYFQAKRNYFRTEKKSDHVLFVCFDQCANHAQTSQTEILERPRFAQGCVQKWVQKDWYVCLEKKTSSFGMRGDTLQKSQAVADSVGLMGS